MAGLSLKHIYKVYPNGTKAVSDFNMEIADKEFIVFVGPSGCGKSTVLRMIAGLEPITAGELTIGGAVVNDVEPKDRDIAMVFQNYALYPHMSIYENIAFGLRMKKVPKGEIDRRVREAAQILGITEYLKRKPKEMSGGQRQRVALGRAIVREPKVMLLDEPLSNLDAKLRTQMRSEIVKLHKKLNTTFIYVTHDQVEAMTMGTRIVVMKSGVIQQIDTPKNLYQHPSNKFVAGFIGTPQMNFFECTLHKAGEAVDIAFAGSDAKIAVPYARMLKTPPSYLTGDKRVILGLRAEDISLDGEKVQKSAAKLKVKISHTEELGTETLVYGDIDMNGDGFGESNTRVIIKSGGFKTYRPDEVLEAALDIDAMHLFDAETEESILPRVPAYNYVDCVSGGGRLHFCGTEVAMPPAMELGAGSCELLIPPEAISFSGDIPAEVVGAEEDAGKVLVSLEMGGRRLFARAETCPPAGKTLIKVDFKQVGVTQSGRQIICPMPTVNRLSGTFELQKSKALNENGKRQTVYSYYANIAGKRFAVPEGVYRKLFGALSGRKVYNTTFDYEFTPYDFTFSEYGLEGEVQTLLDYGAELFAKVTVGGSTLYIKTEKAVSGKVKVLPDLAKVSVVEQERGIRLV